MSPLEHTVTVGGAAVAVSVPLLGIVGHRFVHSSSRSKTDGRRGEDLLPAHGHDCRL